MPEDKSDVEIIGCERVHDGYFKMDRYKLRHRLHEGGWTGPMTRELLERGHAAALLPYDPVLDEVVLIEQFRIGAYAAGWNPWLTEIVAGIIDEGESAEEVVRRETAEEAGLEVGEIERIGAFLPTPGACSETVEVFVGRVDAAKAGGVHGLDHEHEDILVTRVPYADIEAMVRDGSWTNASLAIALQWLVLNHDALRARWT